MAPRPFVPSFNVLRLLAHANFDSYFLSSHSARLAAARVCTSCVQFHRRASRRSLYTARYDVRRSRSFRRSAENRDLGRVRHIATQSTPSTEVLGPLDEDDERVHSHRLRDDEHQRTIVQFLQDLHDMLATYDPPPVIRPKLEDLKPQPKSWISSLFGAKPQRKASSMDLPSDLPKGIYMYGDVGSGKTMLMDLFYDTLPSNVKNKTRIHFHNFMQDVHKRLHAIKSEHGDDTDAILFVAADIAAKASVLCFDEFQCTDVADAMILRRLLEALMSHGVVLVTTSNRKPDDLYKNGIQRISFIPCINLLNTRLRVINLDSDTDYRKIPRPPSGVYHHPLDAGAKSHAEKWFNFLGDPAEDPPHRAVHHVWGREVTVPRASGRAAIFTFDELLGRATGAADYIELAKNYDAFVVTGVPGMTFHQRDLARRFITFIDAVYESKAKLVLTTAVPLYELFLSGKEIQSALHKTAPSLPDSVPTPRNSSPSKKKREAEGAAGAAADEEHFHLDLAARMMMDDLGLNIQVMKGSGLFSADEEIFAFARALSRLAEMGSQEWVERGLGLEKKGGIREREGWSKMRSRWREDMG